MVQSAPYSAKERQGLENINMLLNKQWHLQLADLLSNMWLCCRQVHSKLKTNTCQHQTCKMGRFLVTPSSDNK
jgi:hypothetical protein